MNDLDISINQSPTEPMVIHIRGSEATLYKLAKVIESASEFDPGDSVGAHVGNAVVRITQTEEVKR